MINNTTPSSSSSSDSWEIGDIKLSSRSGLGDNWLLCNGDNIYDSEFPDLSNILNNRTLNLKNSDWTRVNYLSGTDDILKVIYANGYYIGVRYGTNLSVMYGQSLSGPWTENIVRSNVGTGLTLVDFIYKNGYYIILTSGSMYYATSPSGTWKSYNAKGLGFKSGTSVSGIYYDENSSQFILSGLNDSSYPSISYASTPGSTWTKKVIYSGNPDSTYISNVVFYDGYYIAVSSNYLIYATSLDSTWTRRSYISSRYTIKIPVLFQSNGYFYVIGQASSTSNFYLHRIKCDEFLTGTAIRLEPTDVSLTSVKNKWPIYSIIDEKTIIVSPYMVLDSSHNVILLINQPDGVWKNQTFALTTSSGTSYISIGAPFYSTEVERLLMGSINNNFYVLDKNELFCTKLLTISTDGAYNYIKAKE